MIKCPTCGISYEGAEVFCPKDGTRLGGEGEETKDRRSIPPESDPFIGTVIQGRYRVIEQIGEGGMGVVYNAEHVEIEKIVALKVLRDDFSKRPEVVQRFRQEARAASKIGHRNIVDVTDFGQLDDGGVYFVMESLKGQGLSDAIRKTIMSLERAVPIIMQIGRALQAAHKLEIVHRDLKPENVFLIDIDTEKDVVKILDFGIAKISDRDSDGKRLTKTGMIFGTPEYMSPEQAAGKQLDHRVDIYALGCIMFEMFTGQVPFDGESFMAVLTQHMFEPLPLIEVVNPETDIPESVRNVIYKAMAKEVEHRYQDMVELMDDLQRAVDDVNHVVDIARQSEILPRVTGGAPSVTRTPTGATREAIRQTEDGQPVAVAGVNETEKPKRRGLAYIILVVVLIVVGGAVYFLGIGKQKPSRADRPVATVPVPAKVNQVPIGAQPTASEPALPKGGSQDKDSPADQEIEKDVESDKDGAKKIVIVVKTNQENAVVSIKGLGQVCSKAPCEVELKSGEPVEIEAKYKDRTAKMIFTPSTQNRELTLDLKKKRKVRRRGTRRTNTKDTAKPTSPRPSGSGLKIPGIFKDD